MIQEEWQVGTSGRYSKLSRPVAVRRPATNQEPAPDVFVVSIHSQTVVFILFAILVGAGLLMIVPNLSAENGGVLYGGEDSATDTPETVGIQPDASEPTVSEETDLAAQTIASDPETAAVAAVSPVFTREVKYWEPKILEWSQLYNLDPDIIATIMQIESCGDPSAASYAGAQGLFQVMPFHFDASEDMLDPDTNAMRGMAFYNRQLDYTDWDIYLSFAGYNGGYAASGSSYSYWANETQRYYTWAKGIYDDAKAGLAESPTLQQWLAAGGGGGCQRAAQQLGL
jgi:hypothetical protein